jgi:hypothetical protein
VASLYGPTVLSAASVMIGRMTFAGIEFSPDSVVAFGTAILALGTVALAFFTYRLAATATRDQRAEWRPVLVADSDEVLPPEPGELLLVVRNVGRGPALGIHGELRIKGPSGGVIPGQPNVCLPGEKLPLRFSVKGDHGYGTVRRFRVTYYDISEWWHVTDFTALSRNQSAPLTIGQTFVNEMGRQLGAVHGSPRAMAAAKRQSSRPWRRGWRWMRSKAGVS